MLAPSYTIKGIWAATIPSLFLIVTTFAFVQTIRLEGFKVWPISVEGARPKAARLEKELAAIVTAQADAATAQKEIVEAAEKEYEKIAERIDEYAEQVEKDAMARAERFITAQRVRCEAPGGFASGAGAAAPADVPRDRETVPGPHFLDGTVAVPESDVRACTLNTIQANAAREAALALEETSR